MYQYFEQAAYLLTTMTYMFALYNACMYVLCPDYANIIHHAPVSSEPMPNIHHKCSVNVRDTRMLLSYGTYMDRLCASMGIVRSADNNEWHTSIVDGHTCTTHINDKKGA